MTSTKRTDPNSAAWKSLTQTKSALRHIENRLEATPGTGVHLHSVMDTPKKTSSRIVPSRDGEQVDDNGGSSKPKSYSHQSQEKSRLRSPLRNSTLDNNVRRNNNVEFREPLVSYREATPPSSQLETFSLQSVPGSLDPSSSPLDPMLSQLVYQRDTRDKETAGDQDSTHSSAVARTEIHYLNDQQALDALRTVGNQSRHIDLRGSAVEGVELESTSKETELGMSNQESGPGVAPGCIHRGESTPSTSPGSASLRLENLRRHQPDDKLEKLKERIRRQRQHLEEAAEKEKLLACLEHPITAGAGSNTADSNKMPVAKIRKVAAAPPAPIYKGFSSTETTIQTPDGKIWKEEDFHNLSRKTYKDLSQQFSERRRSRHQQHREQTADKSKESRPPVLVRKVHRAAPASDLNAKPEISLYSWHEGKKLVKMVLGSVPKQHSEGDRPHPADTRSGTVSQHRSGSDPHSESNRQSHNSTEKASGASTKDKTKPHSTTTSAVGISTNLLSSDIQGILDDLQLECKAAENEERARQRCRSGSGGRRGRSGPGSSTRASISFWETTGTGRSSSRGCRSASPSKHRLEPGNVAEAGHKKRHYDVDTVREYIARQHEERKRHQAEEQKALREEMDKRHQRLQELYRKQREVAKTATLPRVASVVPVQKRLQETYNKLLLGEAQLDDAAIQMQPHASNGQMRPIYQPSGESDKENKRLEVPQSPSSSDRSLNDLPPPPLPRVDLDSGGSSWLHPDHVSPSVRTTTGPGSSGPVPSNDHLLSQLLRLETAVVNSDTRQSQRSAHTNWSRSNMSRIEALKTTATSLSNRIESEARKLVGAEINYGTKISMDVDTILAPGRSQYEVDDACWTETAAVENNDLASKIRRIWTSTGSTSYNASALPGAGNLCAHREQVEMKNTGTNLTNPQTTSDEAMPIPNSYTQEGRKVSNGFEKTESVNEVAVRKQYDLGENQIDNHDSSADSISEGPILSEGSFSEDESSHDHRLSNPITRGPDCVEALDSCSGQRTDFQRIFEFQKEAARSSALIPPFAQQEKSETAWEELNKGSPLSVINIFIKGLHDQTKVNETNPERNSPSSHYLHSGNVSGDAALYEDDFVSLHSSTSSGQLKRASNSPSINSHFEELLRGSPYEKSTDGISSQHSSFHSSVLSPHLSSGSSPLSKHSTRKQASDQSDATLVEEQRGSCSPPSEVLSSGSKKRGSDKGSTHTQATNVHCNETLGDSSGHSHQNLGLDGSNFRGARPKKASPSGSPDHGSPPQADPHRKPGRSGLLDANNTNTGTTAHYSRAESRTTDDLQYSPAVLHQRMVAELQYLESIEESVRQLDNMEKLMVVSMAQQESVTLAQMLKAKQQQHEQDLTELKIKAEREALEKQLQLEENRQRVAKARIELQESLAANHKETLEGLQEATTKMMSQQAEAAQYTVDAARHIKEMTAKSQIAGALVGRPVSTNSSMLDNRKEQQSSCKQQSEAESDSEMSERRTKPEEHLSSLSSVTHSDSLSCRTPNLSGLDSSSHQSSSHVSSECMQKEAEVGKWRNRGADRKTEKPSGNNSVDEEVLRARHDSLCSDSVPSVVDETGRTTEYSLKFDESMTEDEIEEISFRSLLPSEAHRRGTMDKKTRHHEESEDDGVSHNTSLVPGAHSILKDATSAFSGGQNSFSQFTMDMVHQYMKDEELRLQHQSSLLRLRQMALKEKTRTEVAWLEHQKKRLRDKGEDDKMPPIRKKQRGLLLKLQQEQAEIKLLQEANKAAMKERQLLFKQQEMIERMINSTLRRKKRLRDAGGDAPTTRALDTVVSEPASTNMRHADDNRSPCPSISISGSETSSILQKLKKMRSHMNEKFLTNREQQLVQRRRHAEELLKWKQRLDQEEAVVRRMEKKALAVWDRQTSEDKGSDAPENLKKESSDISSSLGHCRRSESRTDSEKEHVSDDNCSSLTQDSSIHTETLESQQPGSPPVVSVSVPEISVQSSPVNYTQDFSSTSQSPHRQSPTFKSSHSPAASASEGSSKTKMQIRSATRTSTQPRSQPTDTPMAQTEPISDQSDIESRIKALKEELRKRKFMAYQLKKEQKKRHKERLKAQEANLLKQLETYDNIIEKTKAELNKEPVTTPYTSPSEDSTSAAEQSSIKAAACRFEASNIYERTYSCASLDLNTSPQQNHGTFTLVPEELSEENRSTVTPTPARASPVCFTSEALIGPPSNEAKAPRPRDEHIVSDQQSDIQAGLEVELRSGLEEQHSECLLNLEDRRDSQENLSPEVSSSVSKGQLKDASKAEFAVKSASSAMDNRNSSPSHDGLELGGSDPDAFFLKNEVQIKGTEASSPLTDGYHDDFESSVDSTPREEHHKSKSQILVTNEIKGSRKDFPAKTTPYDSQDEEIEEEIAEEPSHHSGSSESSHWSGQLLSLDKQTEDMKCDNKRITSGHSPPVSPQTLLSPAVDEMPSFTIGDRVLVGGVQPGTLKFKGPTSFANGFWAGVELDKSEGSNNGTYDGVVYFECVECHGIFAPPDKITHLPDKFENYVDTTEDEDSFFDDFSGKDGDKSKMADGKSQKQGNERSEKGQPSHEDLNDKRLTDDSDPKSQTMLKEETHLNSQHHKESKHPLSNGSNRDIILIFEDAPTALIISEMEKSGLQKQSQEIITPEGEESHHQFTPAHFTTIITDDEEKDEDILTTFTETLFNNFVKDTVKQFAEIKKAKEQKIEAANYGNEDAFCENEAEWMSSVEQKDGLPFFLPAEKEELSSPELCNRPESPVLGASGQEELAKRLAELELNRELLDNLGDDQDWFDEDFGLSSRREQQRLKQREEEARFGGGGLGRSGTSAMAPMGGLTSSPGGEHQAKTPPRPELPLSLPPKLPEQPAMVVPHSAIEVEKMVHAATQEIWENYGLGMERELPLGQLPNPKPSLDYLGKESSSQDQEALSIRSYRKAVYDLTWEILQEIFVEDPNTDQPQWVKPQRGKSSFFHRVKAPRDLTKTQEFVAAEVLKLYGLAKDQNHQTDWQKMLKFGRKKRDRVDHILVQELHEEEAQWVNYDEDELFVKLQLADSIFDALLRDTANMLTVIYDERVRRDGLS